MCAKHREPLGIIPLYASLIGWVHACADCLQGICYICLSAQTQHRAFSWSVSMRARACACVRQCACRLVCMHRKQEPGVRVLPRGGNLWVRRVHWTAEFPDGLVIRHNGTNAHLSAHFTACKKQRSGCSNDRTLQTPKSCLS